MKLRNITIKKWLIYSATIITLMLVFIGIFTNYYIKDTLKEYDTLLTLKEIQSNERNIRKWEKEFLVTETINPDFHRSTQSHYLENINTDLGKIKNDLLQISNHTTIESLQLNDPIEKLENNFDSYQTYLNRMAELVLTKGFKDFGYVGQMREQIHTVEDELKKYVKPEYAVLMLTLRRHEKDYLLRKDLKYLEKFNKVCKTFQNEIIDNNIVEEQKLVGFLTNYQEIFNKVIQVDVSLGLNNTKGLHGNLASTINEIENDIMELSSIMQKTTNTKIKKTILNLYLLIGLFSTLIVLIILRLSRHIVQSINNLRQYITRLGKGELPKRIKIYNNDEIAEMKKSINELTKNLKNTKEFAIAVGNGNFNQEVNVFGNKGELGSALVEMREKLLQVSQEREMQIKESDQRIWANEGFNQIHNVLASNQKLNEQFYYAVTSKLAKYINANQATLMVTEDRDGETILIQKGTYAWDRNRINEKEISIGEGIIGAAAYEKQSIYMTQLPESYITITSGLGDAEPCNLLVVPCLAENELFAVIEIASFKIIEKHEIEFVEKIGADIAFNLKKMKIEETTQILLDKTSDQATELSRKEEEMRQNMEELQATQEMMKEREKELLDEINKLKKQEEVLLV